jgi:hypothetical protein
MKLLKRGNRSDTKIFIQPHHIKSSQTKRIKLHPNKSLNINKLKSIMKSLDKNNIQQKSNKAINRSGSTYR